MSGIMDNSGGGFVSCTNLPLCGDTNVPSQLAETMQGRCIDCEMLYMRNFIFSEAAIGGESCPVCLVFFEAGEGEKGLFLTYPCGHRVCASCFSYNIEELPGTPRPIPQDFGYTLADKKEEQDFVNWKEDWLNESPDQYAAYSAAEKEYVAKFFEYVTKKTKLMKICPLCRTVGAPLGQDGRMRAAYASYVAPGV